MMAEASEGHMRSRATTLFLASLLGIAAAGCTDNPVGRKCFLGDIVDLDAGTQQTVLSSPALECPSRTCLHVPRTNPSPPEGSEYTDLCTAFCSEDGDCDKMDESPCINGFTCAVATVVGPFCCRKVCICRDYILIPDGGVPLPQACVADNPDNLCCNLPGREGQEQCQ
jgi:hypothetical protein